MTTPSVNPSAFPTNIRDIDLQILASLDDQVLTQACQTNEYVRKLCNGDNLWGMKLQSIFPNAFELIGEHPNVTIKEIYQEFTKVDTSQSHIKQLTKYIGNPRLNARPGIYVVDLLFNYGTDSLKTMQGG